MRCLDRLADAVLLRSDCEKPIIKKSPLAAVCAEMRARGYQYAMFAQHMDFDHPECELSVHTKPAYWHFTEIEDNCELECGDYKQPEGAVVPSMFNWIMGEEFRVDEYANWHIVFLRYDGDPQVLQQVRDRQRLMGFGQNLGFVTLFDWARMRASGVKGVHVTEHENDGRPFGGWHCYPTLAIWDRALLAANTVFFRNAGPFEYSAP